MSEPLGTTRLLPALVIANAGVLVALFFSPNGTHPNLPLSLAGVALVTAGVAMMVRFVLLRGRERTRPQSKVR